MFSRGPSIFKFFGSFPSELTGLFYGYFNQSFNYFWLHVSMHIYINCWYSLCHENGSLLAREPFSWNMCYFIKPTFKDMYTFPFIYTLTLSLNPTNGDLFMFVFYRIKATFYIFPLDVSDSLSIFNMFLLIRKKERLMNMSIKIIIYIFF